MSQVKISLLQTELNFGDPSDTLQEKVQKFKESPEYLAFMQKLEIFKRIYPLCMHVDSKDWPEDCQNTLKEERFLDKRDKFDFFGKFEEEEDKLEIEFFNFILQKFQIKEEKELLSLGVPDLSKCSGRMSIPDAQDLIVKYDNVCNYDDLKKIAENLLKNFKQIRGSRCYNSIDCY